MNMRGGILSHSTPQKQHSNCSGPYMIKSYGRPFNRGPPHKVEARKLDHHYPHALKVKQEDPPALIMNV